MVTYKSKKEFFASVVEHGAVAVIPDNRPSLEDRQAIIEDVTKQVMAQGATKEEIYVDGHTLHFGNQFLPLPKNPRKMTVAVTVKSERIILKNEEYTPNGSFSDKKNWQLSDDKTHLVCLDIINKNPTLTLYVAE